MKESYKESLSTIISKLFHLIPPFPFDSESKNTSEPKVIAVQENIDKALFYSYEEEAFMEMDAIYRAK